MRFDFDIYWLSARRSHTDSARHFRSSSRIEFLNLWENYTVCWLEKKSCSRTESGCNWKMHFKMTSQLILVLLLSQIWGRFPSLRTDEFKSWITLFKAHNIRCRDHSLVLKTHKLYSSIYSLILFGASRKLHSENKMHLTFAFHPIVSGQYCCVNTTFHCIAVHQFL